MEKNLYKVLEKMAIFKKEALPSFKMEGNDFIPMI